MTKRSILCRIIGISLFFKAVTAIAQPTPTVRAQVITTRADDSVYCAGDSIEYSYTIAYDGGISTPHSFNSNLFGPDFMSPSNPGVFCTDPALIDPNCTAALICDTPIEDRCYCNLNAVAETFDPGCEFNVCCGNGSQATYVIQPSDVGIGDSVSESATAVYDLGGGNFETSALSNIVTIPYGGSSCPATISGAKAAVTLIGNTVRDLAFLSEDQLNPLYENRVVDTAINVRDTGELYLSSPSISTLDQSSASVPPADRPIIRHAVTVAVEFLRHIITLTKTIVNNVASSLRDIAFTDNNHLSSLYGGTVFNTAEGLTRWSNKYIRSDNISNADKATLQNVSNSSAETMCSIAAIQINDSADPPTSDANKRKLKKARKNLCKGDMYKAEGKNTRAIRCYKKAWSIAMGLR